MYSRFTYVGMTRDEHQYLKSLIKEAHSGFWMGYDHPRKTICVGEIFIPKSSLQEKLLMLTLADYIIADRNPTFMLRLKEVLK